MPIKTPEHPRTQEAAQQDRKIDPGPAEDHQTPQKDVDVEGWGRKAHCVAKKQPLIEDSNIINQQPPRTRKNKSRQNRRNPPRKNNLKTTTMNCLNRTSGARDRMRSDPTETKCQKLHIRMRKKRLMRWENTILATSLNSQQTTPKNARGEALRTRREKTHKSYEAQRRRRLHPIGSI